MRSRLSTLLSSARRLSSLPHPPVRLHAVTVPPKSGPSPTAQPILVLHGVLASESTYRSLLNRPDFAPEREKIAIDLRNHGRSPHVSLPQAMSYENMLSDVVQFLNERDIQRVTLIGHSMGGKLAMHLALSHPHLVSDLIVVDIAPIQYQPTNDPADAFNVTRAMLNVDLSAVQTRDQVDQQLIENGVTSDVVRGFVMTNLAADQEASSKYRWKVNVNAIHGSMPCIMSFPEQHQRRYEGPTCVIRGGKSKYVPFNAMRTVTSLFPNTKLVTISDGGHWLQSQMPDQFCAAVNDFLQ
ncbi:unnamed protein product [Agarophyton chilense]